MRIGINALYLIPGGVGGTEIYLRQLLGALSALDTDNEYVVFANRETGTGLIPACPNFTAFPLDVRAAFRPARIVWEQTALPLAARRKRIDVLLNPGFTAPLISPCPNVTVFHDMQHKRHPEHFRWFDLPAWRFFLWAAVRRSALVLAVSDATRRDVLSYYGLPEAKLRTVPLGVDRRFFEVGASRREPRPYLLCASTTHPHKNLVPLIRAFAALRSSRPEFSLVITGVRGFHAGAVEAAIAGLALAGHVRLTGWIEREELYALFRDAWAFVYPSTFEGFGLPVLEALAAGLPTACSAIEPLSSIAGAAALKFDPLDERAIEAALERIVSDEELRRRLAAAGPERAREFSWERTAKLTLAALRDASGCR